MKLAVVVLLLVAAAALVTGLPGTTLNVKLDDIFHDQDITEDNVITGSYYWMSPAGTKFFFKYVADDDGFRIVESNAVPVSASGVKADGSQGSFVSGEEVDDRK